MPLKVCTAVDYREEFVVLADQPGANLRELCRRYRFSSRTGYKWLARYRQGGMAALADRARTPHHLPRQTAPAVEVLVIAQRDAQPTWGGRKLHAWLRQQGMADPPAPSTITRILHRHGRIDPTAPTQGPWQRFEHPAPNDLWQLDFMGHRPLVHGRVHPLTILDDHSRFGLALVAAASQRRDPVQAQLTACFERYGLPQAILTDNGPPWGVSGGQGLTGLAAWLIRLGIRVLHGRPYHPQTQGKIERWHRTIGTDVFQFGRFPDLATAQAAFDRFRTTYNTERPHQALAMAVPASRYQPSPRPYPAALPAITYDPDDRVRIVRGKGEIHVGGRRIFLSEGLRGLPVGLRPTTVDGVCTVRFCQQEILTIDLRSTS